MRILHTVEFYDPSVGGAQQVVRQLSEGLAARGHQVTVATTKLAERRSNSLRGVEIQEFEISGNEVRGYSGEVERYQAFLRDGQFDLMMNYAAQEWAADLAFPLLKALPYRKVFVPCGFGSLFHSPYRAYFQKMPSVLRDYDHLVFHSNVYRDIEFARKHDLSHYTVIPNGASEREFSAEGIDFRRKYAIPAHVPLLLTVGNHTGLKGHALSIEAFRKARIGSSVLVIIGSLKADDGCIGRCRRQARWVKLLSGGKKQVLLHDISRADTVAAFMAADLFVFGSNIEYSPLVLFEAMASKTPFVTTACGNADEIVSWGGGGLVIPTKKLKYGYVQARSGDLASAIEALMRDESRRKSLGESGFQAWRRQFTWETLVGRYEQLYRQVISG